MYTRMMICYSFDRSWIYFSCLKYWFEKQVGMLHHLDSKVNMASERAIVSEGVNMSEEASMSVLKTDT